MDGNAAKQVLHLKIGAVLGGALLNKLAILNGFTAKSHKKVRICRETSLFIFAIWSPSPLVGWMAGWNLNDKSDDTFVGTVL